MADEIVYVDFAEGVKRVMNNTKLYTKLLNKFKTDTNLDAMDEALSAGDLEKAQNAAHTLKGLAANLSFTELYRQSLELESQIKARAVAPGQFETLKSVFAQTLQEVDKVLVQYG
jgi:HPt (histidine-containing phosphotransfer) domain-containing protein